MNYIWTTPLPGVLGTVLAYALCVRMQRRARGHALANPVAWAISLLVALLSITKVPYATYFASARPLHFLLGPATVALAIPLARELPRLRRLLWPVSAGLLAGNLGVSHTHGLLQPGPVPGPPVEAKQPLDGRPVRQSIQL